jgi:hypothetical protein
MIGASVKKLLLLIAMISLAQSAAGCGLFGGSKVYDGSEAYNQAHPDQAQPMPYMDPDRGYQNDEK